MPVHITVDAAAAWAANRWIAYQNPQITEARKNHILPVTKYNLMVTAFNVSTVILVIAVASTILCAYSAAVALGSIAIFTRLVIGKELHKYTLPIEPHPAGQVLGMPAEDRQPLQGVQQPQEDHPALQAVNAVAQQLWGQVRQSVAPTILLRHALNQAPQREREDNVFERLHAQRPENWVADEVYVFDIAVWKNKVPVPEALPAAAPAGV